MSASTATNRHCTFHCIRSDMCWLVMFWSSWVCWWDFLLATTFFSGSGEGSKVRSGLHELATCQDKHLVIQCWHLLALLSWNFLLDAAQDNKVTQNKKINIGGRKPTVRQKLLPFLKCVQMHLQMAPAFGLAEPS